MKFFLNSNSYIDTNKGHDLSIPLTNDELNPTAWYVDPPVFEPVRTNGFLGSVSEGGNVNFRNIFFNPHGHGTHTECLGHITKEVHSVNKTLKTHFFNAELTTIGPEKRGGDLIITKKQLAEKLQGIKTESLIIRTTPNTLDKKNKQYSSTNPPYIELEAIDVLNDVGVKHLLIDLPSVDREEDEGHLAFHHAFWEVPESPRLDKTITELIYVNDSVLDGSYILNLQTAPFENDASPSRPILYNILKT